MSARARTGVFLLLIALVAAGSTWLTEVWMRRARKPEDAHDWVHRQLNITPEQDRAIAVTEERFNRQRAVIMERLRLANAELAQAILEGKARSPKVEEAVQKIHAAQADLQQLTLEHVFEMRSALTPEQYDKLLRLTANALSHETHH
jgi:Spy/CpxP family protein refolding chaperone